MKTINVVAAVIIKDNKVFAAQRPNKGEVGLKWEFPGGKIEKGEKDQEALYREIQEEFDTDLNIKEKVMTISHQYKEFKIIMSGYFCTIKKGNLILKEHLDSQWLPINSLENIDWAPADIPIMKEVKRKLESLL